MPLPENFSYPRFSCRYDYTGPLRENSTKLGFGNGRSGIARVNEFCADLNDPNDTSPRACDWCIMGNMQDFFELLQAATGHDWNRGARPDLSSISGADKDANDSTRSHVILHSGNPKRRSKWYAVTIRTKGLSYIGPLGWSNHEVTTWVIMMALMRIMTQNRLSIAVAAMRCKIGHIH